MADNLLAASHIKKTRRAHEIAVAALHILKMKGFDERTDQAVDFKLWEDDRMKHPPMFLYWSVVIKLEANELGFIPAIPTQN